MTWTYRLVPVSPILGPVLRWFVGGPWRRFMQAALARMVDLEATPGA